MTLMEKGCEIVSMDVHPEKPWILASHANGNVSIWNYQTQEKEAESRVSDVKGTDSYGLTHWICSAKFIARREWIVAGDGNGKIHVLNYNTMTEIKKLQAHKRGEWVESLAVHPNQPFVLSASMDNVIRLWNYGKDWQLLWTLTGHDDYVKHVTFSPDGNTFASASQDCTVKIWSTLDPSQPNADRPKLITTLDCGEDTQQHAAYYSMGGRQYMITGSLEGPARIWDLQNDSTVEPADELPGPESEVYGCNVGVVNSVPDNRNPILITTSGDTGISFLDAATHKPRYDKVCFDLGPAQGFAHIEVQGKRSLAIILSGGIAIMEMNEDQVRTPATLEHDQEGISA
ncbi:coatomer subunit beta'-2-like [Triticum dicoccoides]|uniref:coatomer subunit beta'-2-like n=1 Tax=Triticum dicoccoides TaxID=85692 RepID=UPI00188E6E0C|nr:coatomer subunit beta'-2-like [Triticum dicoccoides]